MNFDPKAINQLFYNSRLSELEKNTLLDLKNAFERKYGQSGYFLVPSSGSSISNNESLRLVALKTEAILNSARRFNQYFDVDKSAKWGLVLPDFHIAGIATRARAFCSGSDVVQSDWNVENLFSWINEENVTHLSLVPTQVFDILENEIRCPSQLQVVLVGGAKLNPQNKSLMSGLGWPCYETYGMTETASLVAARGRNQDYFDVLPEVEIKIEDDLLKVKCDSLLTSYVQKINGEIKIWSGLDQQGFLQTEDQIIFHGQQIDFLGRKTDFIKINGEGVSLSGLRDILQTIDRNSIVVAKPDDRSGYHIVLVTESKDSEKIKSNFNQKVKPYEKISEVIYIPKIPRTDLGKIKVAELNVAIDKIQGKV